MRWSLVQAIFLDESSDNIHDLFVSQIKLWVINLSGQEPIEDQTQSANKHTDPCPPTRAKPAVDDETSTKRVDSDWT